MKMTLIFPSRESEDLSFGACYIASFAWLQGNKIVKAYPDCAKYPNGALQDLISELKLKQKIPSDLSDLVIVKHPNGHGDEDDIKAIKKEAISLGLKPNVVMTRVTEVNNSSDDSDEITSELFASEFRDLVYSYNRRKALREGDAKFTQSRLARKLGLSESAFSKLLSGKNMSIPSRIVMRKITDFFGREINKEEPNHLLKEKTYRIRMESEKTEKEICYLREDVEKYRSKLEDISRRENKDHLREYTYEFEKAQNGVHRAEEIQLKLAEEKAAVEKEVSREQIISEGYSNDMKKSLDKLKHIYLGGI